MPLQPLTLDDLTWQQMVDAARRRIMAASGSRWTLHAPVDPGVTLLELFAWLLEQRVYFADQVTPELQRALLRLLGEAPRPASAAATVLQFMSGQHAAGQPPPKTVRVGAGTQMQPLSARRATLIFSTDTALTVVPLRQAPIGVYARGQDRTLELQQGHVDLTAPGQPMDVAITLPLSQPLPVSTAKQKWPALSLFVDLDSGPIAGEWVPALAATVPPPAHVELWRRDQSGGVTRFPAGGFHDGTGGLRRPGIVRLPLDGWAPEPGTNDYVVQLRCTQTVQFAFPPRLLGVELNACIARQRRRVVPPPFHADWPLLSDKPSLTLTETPVMTETVSLSLRERAGAWMRWSRVDDFVTAGPGDRVFTIDRDSGRIRFGDGLTARLPVLSGHAPPHNLPNVRLRYEVGGGSVGNFSSGQAFEATAHHLFRAVNLVDSVGGTDAETPADARDRAADDEREVTRAVTAADYETLAETTPGAGIVRAHAAVGLHPSYSCLPVPGAVTVVIVPWAPRPIGGSDDDSWDADGWTWAPEPDPGARAAVCKRLEAARLVGSEVFVRGPIYRHAALLVRLQGDPLDPVALQQAIARRLRIFLDPLRGGDDGSGWPFGEPLRPSALLREAQTAIGHQADVQAVVVTLDGVAPGDECSDVPIGAHDLPVLDSVRVELQRVFAARSGLR